MSGLRHLHVLMLATCVAGVCHAQPGAQIAATKSHVAAGPAVVGGPTPTRSTVKPRFPILPAGAVIQPVDLKARPRTAATPASTNAPTGAKAAENKATSGPSGNAGQGAGKGSRSKALSAPSAAPVSAAAQGGGTQSH